WGGYCHHRNDYYSYGNSRERTLRSAGLQHAQDQRFIKNNAST
ncbi:MAG: hypothetical protein ACI81P_003405, partial [Neolewinella sp.]